jgi:hypothetical protein
MFFSILTSFDHFLSLFPAQLSNKMGGTDRCVILFYAASTTTDIGLLLVAPAPLLFLHETCQYKFLITFCQLCSLWTT